LKLPDLRQTNRLSAGYEHDEMSDIEIAVSRITFD
jgi:hypothetical protein